MLMEAAGFLIGAGAVLNLGGIMLTAEYRYKPGMENLGPNFIIGGITSVIAGLSLLAAQAIIKSI